jgi:hypothetical protein
VPRVSLVDFVKQGNDFGTMLLSHSEGRKQPMKTTPTTISAFNAARKGQDKKICAVLRREIDRALPDAESKIWHGSPVWFLDGNPIVGYCRQKAGIRLMFWSGASFDEKGLNVRGAKFKDASVFYNAAADIPPKSLKRWLIKSRNIQWDYKNIVKRKGVLIRIK